jgi:hypothetical protein
MTTKLALALGLGLALVGSSALAQGRQTTIRTQPTGPGASEFAPGQQPRTGTMRGASQFAPGQQMQRTGRPARTFAPGQRARLTTSTGVRAGGGAATVRTR